MAEGHGSRKIPAVVPVRLLTTVILCSTGSDVHLSDRPATKLVPLLSGGKIGGPVTRRGQGKRLGMTMSGVEGAAFKEAERLGHNFVGPEHGVLAVLRGDPADLARLALEDVGITTESVEKLLGRMIQADPQAMPERAPGISPNPAWYRVIGRAEGFAASIGTGDVRPLDLVLALLWSRRPLLDQPAASREALVEALAQRGAGLPPTPLPELERRPRFTQNVEFPRRCLAPVLALLHERHPVGVGPTYGFNHDGAERAWVNAEEGIDFKRSWMQP